jgi:disease resistance protein RPS2
MARDSLRAVETTVRMQVTAEEDKLNVCGPQVQVWLKRVHELCLDTIDEDYVAAPRSASLLWTSWRR